jgi:hypothetical protein
MTYAIQAEGLMKRFGETVALDCLTAEPRYISTSPMSRASGTT